jgi:hypothetical protein
VAYKGVGRKTAEAAVDAFGANEIYHVLEHEPDRVREALGARLAKPLMDGWAADETKPSLNGSAPQSAERPERKWGARKTSRGSRGGKGRKKAPTRK